jgi:hypothetical protein
MDDWLARLVAHTGYPESREVVGGFEYRFAEETAAVAEIAKTVRVISGLNACLLLADHGFVAEAATLLRTVTDFVNEILFLAEGQTRREGATTDQRQFVEDFFAKVPTTVEEMQTTEKRQWLRRDAIYKPHKRLGEGVKGFDEKTLIEQGKFLDMLLNGYAHGGYRESMDLYNGHDCRFETRGIPSEEHEKAVKANITLKVHYCGNAFMLMAIERNLHDLFQEIANLQEQLQSASEYQQ